MIERLIKKFVPKESQSIDWDKQVIEAENQWRAEAFEDLKHMENCNCHQCKHASKSLSKQIELDELRRNARTYVDWGGDTLTDSRELTEDVMNFTADEVIEAKLRRGGGRK